MVPQTYERTYGQPVTIDICDACQGLWFDDLEMVQLSPGATLSLFRHIQEHATTARVPLAARLGCARCLRTLDLAHDMQRTTRFWYYRCADGHGRFTTFFQFLRAKNFVRSLTAKEVAELRQHIRQINCANCGAPVDIAADAVCGFCRTPVSMLDPEQMRNVALELQRAEAPRACRSGAAAALARPSGVAPSARSTPPRWKTRSSRSSANAAAATSSRPASDAWPHCSRHVSEPAHLEP